MPHLVRLTYASKTASAPASIRDDLKQILKQARQHNFNHGIHGVLFYGNDHYFQCLEGRKLVVDALYEKILNDSRHYQVQLISYTLIDYANFQNWDMKYVLHEKKVQDFFRLHQQNQFNPYHLKGQMHDDFIDLLCHEQESEAGESEVVNHQEPTSGKALHAQYVILIWLLALMGCAAIYYFFNKANWIVIPASLFK